MDTANIVIILIAIIVVCIGWFFLINSKLTRIIKLLEKSYNERGNSQNASTRQDKY